MTQTLNPTSGSAWRQRRSGVVVELPSGLVARVRYGIDLAAVLRLGRLPDALTTVVSRVFEGAPLVSNDVQLSEMREIYQFMETICRIAFVEPRIVDNPQSDDEISINDLVEEDILFVYRGAMRPITDLDPFRTQQSATVEAVDTDAGNETVTELPAAD